MITLFRKAWPIPLLEDLLVVADREVEVAGEDRPTSRSTGSRPADGTR